jgi:hypothetical protein
MLRDALIAYARRNLVLTTPLRIAKREINKAGHTFYPPAYYYRYWGSGLKDKNKELVPALLRDVLVRAEQLNTADWLRPDIRDEALRRLRDDLEPVDHPRLRPVMDLLTRAQSQRGPGRETALVKAVGLLSDVNPQAVPAQERNAAWSKVQAICDRAGLLTSELMRTSLKRGLAARVEWERAYRKAHPGTIGMPAGRTPEGVSLPIHGSDTYGAALVSHHLRAGLSLAAALDATFDDIADIGYRISDATVVVAEAAATLLALDRVDEAIDAYWRARTSQIRDGELLTALAARVGRYAYAVNDSDLLESCVSALPDEDDPRWEDGLCGGMELYWLSRLSAPRPAVPKGLISSWVQALTERDHGEWTPGETGELLVTALDRSGRSKAATEVARDCERHLQKAELGPADARRLHRFQARVDASPLTWQTGRTRFDEQIDELYQALLERRGPVDVFTRVRLQQIAALVSRPGAIQMD